MRAVVLTLIIMAVLPFCFRYPWIGGLVWSWLGFMNPHRLAWATQIPYAMIVAVVTLAGLAVSRDRRPIPITRETVLLGTFWGLAVVSTALAVYPELARPYLVQFSKILLMSFVLIAVFQDRVKLRYLLIVSALSIGFFGVKGGVWVLTGSGGEVSRVLGPQKSFIGENNALALALSMTLPLLAYLALEERRRWARIGLWVTFGLCIVSVLMTFSRSGFLGLSVVLLILVLRTRFKMFVLPVVVLGALAALFVVPSEWVDRIETIGSYDEDGSALSRLRAWRIALRLAADYPLFGAGFGAFAQPTWIRYMPDYHTYHNAHSIYFHALGELGLVGLTVYLALIGSTLVSLVQIRRRALRLPGAEWMSHYAAMVQASLAGYLVCGAFVNLTYFDLFYLLVVVTVILRRLLAEAELEAAAPSSNGAGVEQPGGPGLGDAVRRRPGDGGRTPIGTSRGAVRHIPGDGTSERRSFEQPAPVSPGQGGPP